MPSFASYPSLKDRSVFVSGGGSGIGASIVEHFAEQGARVAFVDVDEPASTALVKKVAASGHRGDAEPRLHLGDGDGPGTAQQVCDRRPASLGQHRSV